MKIIVALKELIWKVPEKNEYCANIQLKGPYQFVLSFSLSFPGTINTFCLELQLIIYHFFNQNKYVLAWIAHELPTIFPEVFLQCTPI